MKSQLTLAAILLLLVGCKPDPLTRSNFERIRPLATTQAEVATLIGEPDGRLPGMWTYTRADKHLTAIVEFDDAGRVTRVQWVDAMLEEWADSKEKPGQP